MSWPTVANILHQVNRECADTARTAGECVMAFMRSHLRPSQEPPFLGWVFPPASGGYLPYALEGIGN